MSAIVIGSARKNENGTYYGGVPGDSTKAEVSTQEFYPHKKGWYVLNAIDDNERLRIAERMWAACRNDHIGYSQKDRYGLRKHGIDTLVNCNCDCSQLQVQVVKEATGVDIKDATTVNLVSKLMATGKFTKEKFSSKSQLKVGSILVTCTKGHTATVVSFGGTYADLLALLGKEHHEEHFRRNARPTLKVGSVGTEVEILQDNLIVTTGCKLDCDGLFGGLTKSALINWQRSRNLEPDGIYGPISAGQMKEEIGNV